MHAAWMSSGVRGIDRHDGLAGDQRQPPFRPHPDAVAIVVAYRPRALRRQAVRDGKAPRRPPVADERHASVRRGPHLPAPIDTQGADGIAGQTVGHGQACRDAVGGRVQVDAGQAHVVGRDPQGAVGSLSESADDAGAEGSEARGRLPGETVEPDRSALRTNPEVAARVVGQGIGGSARDAQVVVAQPDASGGNEAAGSGRRLGRIAHDALLSPDSGRAGEGRAGAPGTPVSIADRTGTGL